MVDDARDLKIEWIAGRRRVGVTAGASAPETLVAQVIARLRELGAANVAEVSGVVERIVFPMPRGLAAKPAE
jgi:4-hydroxy-3-methylbut-2-enyl diphosphate reductase